MLPIPVLTYAQYVALTLGSMALPPQNIDPSILPNTTITAGWNSNNEGRGGHVPILSFEHLSKQDLIYGLRPIFAAGISPKGLAYLSPGIRKEFMFGSLRITPNFGPALFTSDLRAPSASETIQFRTGIDISYRVTERTYAGLGFYHMSNAGLTKRSAGVDAYTLSLSHHW